MPGRVAGRSSFGTIALVAAALALIGDGAFASLAGARDVHAGADDAELVSRGRRLYLVSCASCHGVNGRGTRQGPTLMGVGAASADFMLTTGRMPLSDPDAQAVRKPPAFTPRQIDALVA